MALYDDLASTVKTIFHDAWTERNGAVVPESENLKMSNDAVKLDAAVLYADLSASTKLVDSFKATFAAEVYKAYLHCAAKIIRDENGVITAYDGDRVMAVFIGDSKESSAVRAALKINFARTSILNPAIKAQYPSVTYEIRHTAGIDTSPLFVARTGIRGSNDLVWVGRAANYAAKLAAFPPNYPSRLTLNVYQKLDASLRKSKDKPIWTNAGEKINDVPVYGSTWHIEIK